MATVGPVRSRRSYCWEAAAPNSEPDTKQCTKQYTRPVKNTRKEHQTPDQIVHNAQKVDEMKEDQCSNRAV